MPPLARPLFFCAADDEVAPGWLGAMGQALALHDFVVARLDHRKLNAEWLHPVQGDGYQSAGLYKMPVPPYFFRQVPAALESSVLCTKRWDA